MPLTVTVLHSWLRPCPPSILYTATTWGKRPNAAYEGKVVPVLNEAIRHADVWGNWGLAPRTLSPGNNGGEWSASSLAALLPRIGPLPHSQLDKRLVEPQADLVAMARRKILPCWKSNSGSSVRNKVIILPGLPRLLVRYSNHHKPFRYTAILL
jgi:hypothetical protein